VYASTDITTGPPPDSWPLEAGIEFCYRPNAKLCARNTKCELCKWCVFGKGNVYFKPI